jgi:GNAT superfamily N-acetyltransferase
MAAEVPTGDLMTVPVASIDAGEVAEFVNAAFRRYEILGADRTSPEALLEEAGNDAEFFELRNGAGRLVATALIRPAARYYTLDDDISADVDLASTLYFGLAGVDPALQNSGLGRRLVADAERLAQSRGYRSVLLTTLREFGLVEYYSRAGYAVVRNEDFPAGHWGIVVPHRLSYMVRAL